MDCPFLGSFLVWSFGVSFRGRFLWQDGFPISLPVTTSRPPCSISKALSKGLSPPFKPFAKVILSRVFPSKEIPSKRSREFLGTHQFTRLFRRFSIPSGSLVFLRLLLRAFFEKITSGLSTARLIPSWMNI